MRDKYENDAYEVEIAVLIVFRLCGSGAEAEVEYKPLKLKAW